MVFLPALESNVAALPSLLLILTAAALGATRDRSLAVQRGIALSGTLGSGASVLWLRPLLPLETGLSVWRPADLFQAGLALTLDELVWSPMLLAIALLLAALLHTVDSGERPSSALLAMGGLAMAGMQASNPLTLAVLWTLMGSVTLTIALLRSAENISLAQATSRSLFLAAPILLLIAAAGLAPQDAGATMNGRPMAMILLLAVMFMAGGALVTLGSGPDSRSTPAYLPALPAAAAVVALARWMSAGPPPGVRIGFIVLGMGALFVGSAGLWLERSVARSSAWFRIAIAGGAIAATLAGREGAAAVAGAAGVILAEGGLRGLSRVVHSWQRIWPLSAGAAALAIPGFPLLLGPDRAAGSIVIALVGLLGIAGLAAGVWVAVPRAPSPEASSPAGRLTASDVAVAGLLIALVAMAASNRWLSDALPASIAAMLAWGLHRIEQKLGLSQRVSQATAQLAASGRRVESGIAHGIRLISALVRGLVGLFDGAGAMLWVFLAVVALILALRTGMGG